MKMLWIAVLLILAGCNQGDTFTLQDKVARCQAGAEDPTSPAGCYPGFEQLTAIDFGDSVSLAYSGHARLRLAGVVDFRHDAWEHEDIEAHDNPYFFGQVVAMGHNNGYSTTLVNGMTAELDEKHYNVILFNSGLHDIQPRAGAPNVDLVTYQANIEAAAWLAEQHADVVIWIDTTDVPAALSPSVQQYGAPAHAQVPYNQVAHEIAREHGFYILNISSEGQRIDDVHFRSYGVRKQGNEIAACVLVALQQEETAICHK